VKWIRNGPGFRMIVIWLLISIVLIWGTSASIDRPGEPAVSSVSIVRMPGLVACGCDDAYRCMSDQDYMQLVAIFSEEPETFAPSFCQGCP